MCVACGKILSCIQLKSLVCSTIGSLWFGGFLQWLVQQLVDYSHACIYIFADLIQDNTEQKLGAVVEAPLRRYATEVQKSFFALLKDCVGSSREGMEELSKKQMEKQAKHSTAANEKVPIWYTSNYGRCLHARLYNKVLLQNRPNWRVHLTEEWYTGSNAGTSLYQEYKCPSLQRIVISAPSPVSRKVMPCTSLAETFLSAKSLKYSFDLPRAREHPLGAQSPAY